jgi:predicted MFS family arabinose efflux permease
MTERTEAPASEADGSALAPLGHRTYRWLWMAFSAFNMGVWIQSFGAQWFLVSRPDGVPYVALVQVVMTLPMALLALPAGVLADTLDRRRLLILVQSGALLATSALVVLTWLDLVGVPSMLVLTALVGISNALSLMPFQSLVPDLVPHPEIPAASALVAVGANLARIIGPAVAGLVVARLGVPAVFALAASTCALFVAVLVPWSGGVERVRRRERFFPAVRSGVRYVRHSPQVLRLMVRSFWFTAGMMSIFAQLPLLATQVLDLGSGGFGSLLACVGIGAVVGGLSAARLRRGLSANTIVGLSFGLCAVAVALMPLVTVLPLTVLLLVAAGWGWTLCLSTMAASMQLYLPAWVRARGLATYWMAMYGGQAVGSVLLGAVAQRWGLGTAFFVSALLLALGATMPFWLPLRQLDGIDRSPSIHWPEPQLVVDVEEIDGEVVVQVVYWVDQDVEEAFLTRMVAVRRARLRTGGTGWRLLKDAEIPRRFVEEYSVGSWDEHEYQHKHRMVVSDREQELDAAALSSPAPHIRRLYRFGARS